MECGSLLRCSALGLLSIGMIPGLSGCLKACQPKPPSNLEVPAEAMAAASAPAVPANLVIDTYVDGSGSIEHFLHNPGSQQKSDDLPAAGGPNYLFNFLTKAGPELGAGHTARFWRFGGDCPTSLSNDDVASMGTHPGGSFPEPDTKLDVPYLSDPREHCAGHAPPSKAAGQTAEEAPSGPPELRILVSDLYVSNPKHPEILNAVGRMIADKYLRDDSTAVCILAIRNPYYGRVEDLPDHTTSKPVATSMPFYVILAGPAPAVQFGVRVLLDKVGLFDAFKAEKAQLFYFSRDQGHYDGSVPQMEQAPHRIHLFHDKYRDSAIPFYLLDEGTMKAQWAEPSGVTWASASSDWEPKWSISAGRLNGDSISALLYSNQKDEKDMQMDKPSVARAAKSCTSGLTTCINIDRSGLLNRRNYLIRVDALESQSNDFKPDAAAMQGWSIEMADAAAVSHDASGRFPRIHGVNDPSPGRTPALSEFLTVLQSGIFPDSTQQRIANHHYIFVHAN